MGGLVYVVINSIHALAYLASMPRVARRREVSVT
jgi:hypothetical protein